MPQQIAVLAPMPSELRPVVRALGLSRADRGTGEHHGVVGDVRIVAAGTGIGPELAAEATERVLARHRVDRVVVCGIAGGIEGATTVGELVLPAEAVDAVDGSRFTATPMPGTELSGAVRTAGADSYQLTPGELDAIRADGVVALDMETAAVARVCERHGVPWSAFRAISDMAGDDSVGEEVLTLVRPDGSPDLRAAARFFLRHPQRIPRFLRLGRESAAASRIAAEALADSLSVRRS